MNTRKQRLLLAITVLTIGAHAQTVIDLRTQSKNVDFSTANFTKTTKTGTMLPGTCAVGETFFKIDAQPGKNHYGCTAPNTWTALGSGLPDVVVASPTCLTVGGGKYVFDVGKGKTVFTINSPATFCITGGTTVETVHLSLVYNNGNPQLVGDGAANTYSFTSGGGSCGGFSSCVVTSTGTWPTDDYIPIATIATTETQQFSQVSTDLVDYRAAVTGRIIKSGPGEIGCETGACGPDPSVVLFYAAGSSLPASCTPSQQFFLLSDTVNGIYQAYICNNGSYSPANIGIVSSLPASCSAQQLVFNSTDRKMYVATTPGIGSCVWTSLAGAGTVTSITASGGVETASGFAITGTGTLRSTNYVNVQSGSTYTLQDSDRGKTVKLSCPSGAAVTLPTAGTTQNSTFAPGWWAILHNAGTSNATLTPQSGTIEGGSSYSLAAGAAMLISDGTGNWDVVPFGGAIPANVMKTDVANTLTATGSINESASTTPHRDPNISGGGVSTASPGQHAYDTTTQSFAASTNTLTGRQGITLACSGPLGNSYQISTDGAGYNGSSASQQALGTGNYQFATTPDGVPITCTIPGGTWLPGKGIEIFGSLGYNASASSNPQVTFTVKAGTNVIFRNVTAAPRASAANYTTSFHFVLWGTEALGSSVSLQTDTIHFGLPNPNSLDYNTVGPSTSGYNTNSDIVLSFYGSFSAITQPGNCFSLESLVVRTIN
jgi:hypothetical protein